MQYTKLLSGLIATFLLSGLLTACGGEKKDTPHQATAVEAIKVKVQQAKLTEVPMMLTYSGKVEADKAAQLSTKLMGTLYEVNVDEGQQVRKGEVLARIRSADLQASGARIEANMTEAQAALENAKKDYERIKTLVAQKSATQKELDDIKTHYQMAKAKIEALEQAKVEINETLDYATIRAPFNGVVTKKMKYEGDLATPGMPILSLETNQNYKVVAKVPESDIAAFNPGEMVTVRVDAIGASMKGVIDQVNPSGQYGGGQFEITIKLQPDQEATQRLKNGLFASVKVQKGAAQKILVPENIVMKRGQLTGFFTLNQQSEAMLRWVRTGKTENGQVEVLSGLAAGEQVIIQYKGRLKDGQKVQVIN